MTFWLFVIVFSALGVHRLWSSMVQPKIVNWVLLPGTLVAQVGYIVGMLVTGGTINNTSLVKDDESGEPQTGGDEKPKLPVVGSIIIALLPMAGCAVAIYWAARYFGAQFLKATADLGFNATLLPVSLESFFATIRGGLGLAEHFVGTVRAADLGNWETLLFLYLAVCLTVRMAPLTGNIRGALGAIVLAGILGFLAGKILQPTGGAFAAAWPLVIFCVAVLLCLLILSLLAAAVVGLVKTLLADG